MSASAGTEPIERVRPSNRPDDSVQGAAQLAHRQDIDGLRAIAVAVVVLFHAGMSGLGGGFVGVDVFFVISGYLITGIISRDIAQGKFSIITFYERRIRRIFPALSVVLIVSAILAKYLLLPHHLVEFGKSLAAAMLFASNIFFQNIGQYFDGPSELRPLLHTWSLSVEEQFYIFFPVYLFIASKLFRPRRVVHLSAVLALVFAALSAWTVRHHPKAAFYLAPTRAHELLIGGLLSMKLLPDVKSAKWRDLLSVLGLAMIVASVFGYSEETPFPGWQALLPCVGAALIIYAGTTGPSLVGRLLSVRPMRGLGLISYSLYLWHWPLLAFARYWAIRQCTALELTGVVILAVLVSIVSWRFVEQPFRGKNAVFTRKPLFAVAGLVLVTFTASGLYLAKRQPYPASIGWAEADVPLIITPAPGQHSEQCLPKFSASGVPSDGCVIGSPEAKELTFLAWGDSHAQVLSFPLGKVANDAGKAGLAYAVMACPPIIGVRKVSPGIALEDNDFCWRSNEGAFRMIMQTPTIKDVVLVARWQWHATSFGYASEWNHRIYLYKDGSKVRMTESEVEDAIVETVRTLIAAGKRVHFVESAPEFSYRAPESVGRVLMYGRDPRMLDEPVGPVEERAAIVRRIADRFKSEPKFKLIPTHDLFCKSDVCSFRSPRGPLYYDSNHFGALANGMLGERIASIFSP
jgi:peptidoglycan/LPS O-acetylase OafA/YrhL